MLIEIRIINQLILFILRSVSGIFLLSLKKHKLSETWQDFVDFFLKVVYFLTRGRGILLYIILCCNTLFVMSGTRRPLSQIFVCFILCEFCYLGGSTCYLNNF